MNAQRSHRALLIFHHLNHEQSCNMAVSMMEILSKGGGAELASQKPNPQLLPTSSALLQLQIHSLNFTGIESNKKSRNFR